MPCLRIQCPWTNAEWHDIAMCADAADGVYEDAAFIRGWTSFRHVATSDCEADPTHLRGCYDRAVLFRRQGDLVLAFRGTVNAPYWLSEWKTNLNCFYGRATHGAHRGFFRAVERVWPRIHLAVEEERRREGYARLFITGHSKGAGMARVAAEHLLREEKENVHLITFSEPPVYNPFARTASARSASSMLAIHRRLIFSVDFLPALSMFLPNHCELALFTQGKSDSKHQHHRQSVLQYVSTSFIEGWKNTNPFPLTTKHGIGAYRQLAYLAAGIANFEPLPRHQRTATS